MQIVLLAFDEELAPLSVSFFAHYPQPTVELSLIILNRKIKRAFWPCQHFLTNDYIDIHYL
jgi:hypothetical protein